jgi:hypothetical protein
VNGPLSRELLRRGTYRSCPFRRFLPLLLFAACATCFALLMAAFLMSLPFMVHFPATRWAAGGTDVRWGL